MHKHMYVYLGPNEVLQDFAQVQMAAFQGYLEGCLKDGVPMYGGPNES